MSNGSDPRNQARIGLYIVCGVALAGLVLLMAAEAATEGGAGRNWPFNAFLLFVGAFLWLYVGVIFRSQQNLWQRVEASERGHQQVESTLVQALDRLRAGDLVNCAEHARLLPGKVSVTLGIPGPVASALSGPAVP